MAFNPSIPPATRTSLDVAIWFLDRARTDDSHLPFQKLHRLLYLAQSLYAAQKGSLLMPAMFLAEEIGPSEPNIHRLLADGRPEEILIETPTGQIRDFLELIWDRYGHMSIDCLNELIAHNRAYVETRRGYVIDTAAMAAAIVAPAPQAERAQRVLRSQNGAPVRVRAWSPLPSADAPGTTKTKS